MIHQTNGTAYGGPVCAIIMLMKTCTKCGVTKKLTDFTKRRGSSDGVGSHCKQCKSEYNKRRNAEEHSPRKIAHKERQELFNFNKKRCTKCNNVKSHTEFHRRNDTWDNYQPRCIECRNNYYKENFEYISARNKKRYDPAYRKKYYLDNIDRHRAYRLSWKQDNIDSLRQYGRQHYLNNVDYYLNKGRRWRKDNPGRSKDIAVRYRTRKLDAWVEDATYEEVIALHGDTCLFPGCNSKDIHLDHVIPLSEGGLHELKNLQPLCGSHNSQKWKRYADFRTPPEPLPEHTFWHLFLNNNIWIP